ncbi:centromere protein R isoform X2 [Sturnira hondurensis]|uniref:centromere protein R isoform X2 n=1 Tax=Sturnira hondurensis TaxID=192404 RepID=UPI00187A0AC0|nr:centromere protein R isoform X2 [Sturnira hondurensis]
MDTLFLLSPLAFGSVVAEVVFPAGYVECDTTTGKLSPAFFRLLCFLREALFSEEVAQLVLSSGGDPSLNVKMPVKRSLKLDDPLEANSFGPSKITRKKSTTDYSPTTGTRQLSPFASPTRSKEQEHQNGPSKGKRKKLNHPSLTDRKKSTTKDDELMVLLSKVEKSSEEIVKIIQGLSSIQALEGNRKLENLIGLSCGSCFLRREIQKTKELKLHHLDSYEFLKAILN